LTFSATLQGTNYMLSGGNHCTKRLDSSTAGLQVAIALQMIRKEKMIRLSSHDPMRQSKSELFT
jgi:hypothetical protein